MPTPERTSLAQIIAAGAALLEEGGESAVTMQAVAHAVGVRAPSLYKRVRDRDALIRLVAETTADELGRQLVASDGSIGDLARTYRAFAQARPEGFRLLFAVAGDEGPLSRVSDPLIAAARRLVGDERALDAARLVTAWATGFLTMELAGAFRLGGDLDEAFAFGLERIEAGLGVPT